jgi:hypothetical protein
VVPPTVAYDLRSIEADQGINVWCGERIIIMDLRDQWVRFKTRDIYYPDLTKVLIDLHCNDLLSGKVVDLSDNGMQKDAFVIVKVERLDDLLIVPVERLFGSMS